MMANYRRWRIAGGTVFLTIVVHQRYDLFKDDKARVHLRRAFQKTRNELPFKIVAICLLPDHLHMIWQLPDHDDDYSTRAKMLKASFTESWLAVGGWEGNVNASRKNKGERGVWQRRFWEHTIRNEEDLENCVHYIHWNPRKHGLVTQVVDYPYSSFHRFVCEGHYDAGWGGSDPCGDWPEAEFVRE